MSDLDMYEVVNQTKYQISYRQVENIEDCPDEYLTKDEIRTITGDNYVYRNGDVLLESKIKKDLKACIDKIPEGKKSCKIPDDLAKVLKDAYQPISHFIEGTRRVGNRVSIHTKSSVTKTVPSFRDLQRLVARAELYYRIIKKVYITISVSNSRSRDNIVDTIKSLCTWDQLMDPSIEKNYNCDGEDLVMMKKLYEDPSLTPQKKVKK